MTWNEHATNGQRQAEHGRSRMLSLFVEMLPLPGAVFSVCHILSSIVPLTIVSLPPIL